MPIFKLKNAAILPLAISCTLSAQPLIKDIQKIQNIEVQGKDISFAGIGVICIDTQEQVIFVTGMTVKKGEIGKTISSVNADGTLDFTPFIYIPNEKTNPRLLDIAAINEAAHAAFLKCVQIDPTEFPADHPFHSNIELIGDIATIRYFLKEANLRDPISEDASLFLHHSALVKPQRLEYTDKWADFQEALKHIHLPTMAIFSLNKKLRPDKKTVITYRKLANIEKSLTRRVTKMPEKKFQRTPPSKKK